MRTIHVYTILLLLLSGAFSMSAKTVVTESDALQAQAYKKTLTLAADGSGDCRTFAEAFEMMRAFMDYEVTLFVRKGIYKEKVIVPSWLTNIEIVGEDRDATIIRWSDHANINKMGTFRTYTMRVDGSGITFRNLTIENDAPRLGQAVALHTEGDRLHFVNCRFLGNQDTIYTGREGTRLLFENCYIEGTTDFIFGPSVAWFEDCTIYSKVNSYITAASTPAEYAYGYVFNRCHLTAADSVSQVYLGRPWRPFAATVFMNCDMDKHIRPEGWHNWNNAANERTARYAEYANSGSGAMTEKRVSWAHILNSEEAANITRDKVFSFSTDNTWGRQQISSAEAWKTLYPSIEKHIVAPTFKDKDFSIADFGAKADDTLFLNTKSINNAIETCSNAGGGRVIVPPGLWFTGPITLKSNVNLHISEGATLLFTKDLKQYPLVITRWEGMDCYNYQPMIYAYNETNIAITGKGTIDGGATKSDWWAMCGAAGYGWKEGIVSQRIGRPQLQKWNEDGVPIVERNMGDGYGMRVQLINLYQCDKILIEDVELLRSPFWVIHPLLCENLTVRRARIFNEGPNGDGCDPESCRNVLIEDCDFDTGDDCIAIKSGRNQDGRRWGRPSENIIVRNCRMKNGHGGVVVGSEISGGYRNLFVENCKMDSPELERVIRIKTNSCRGGIIENIYVRNVEVGQCKEAVLKINLVYEQREVCERGFYPIVRNVYLDNVNCNKSKYGVMITAFDDRTNVYNIEVANSSFNGVTTDANSLNGKIDNVAFKKLKINGKEVE